MFAYAPDIDIAASEDDLIVNTVNCVGVMGAGVALAVRNRYPDVMAPYKQACEAGRLSPGRLHVFRQPGGPVIVNMATKDHWRAASRLDWVGSGLFYLSRFVQMEHARAPDRMRSLTLPPPGCGHGGLSWRDVHVMARTCLAPLEDLGIRITITQAAPPPSALPLIYAGVGARDTPQEVLTLMHDVGHNLAREGFLLRSGGARGADSAFEAGCREGAGVSEIFRKDADISPLFDRLTDNLHPKPSALSPVARLLMNRNGAQVFGAEFSRPCDVLLCWTPGGAGGGGTGQAIRIARAIDIPALDLGAAEFSGACADIITSRVIEVARHQRSRVTHQDPEGAPIPALEC